MVIYLSMVGRPSFGSMLVYIDVASAVKSCAEGGRGGRSWRALRTSWEFLTYAGM